MIYNKSGNELQNAYQLSGTDLATAYNYQGDEVWNANRHLVSDNYTVTELFSLTNLDGGTQGFACDSLSQSIAQLYSASIYTIDIATGTITQRTSGIFNNGHGSTGQFAPEKLQNSDLFPPLYVSNGSNATINGNRYGQLLEVLVQESTCVMNKIWVMPIPTETYGMSAIDFENQILYHVTRSKYEPDSGETIDYTYVYAYDMTQAESLTSGYSYNPIPVNGYYKLQEPTDAFTVPYISEMQAISFFDGLIACLSDTGKVVFIDVETKQVYLTITQNLLPREREGISFLYNPLTDKTDMILSTRTNMTFARYEFS